MTAIANRWLRPVRAHCHAEVARTKQIILARRSGGCQERFAARSMRQSTAKDAARMKPASAIKWIVTPRWQAAC